ncbi:right-handed parallel beta-helix repeat-containing protein [Verrucosispora sp. WMMA2121]|uniref:right-handed parallel beta-helix repeat-containing protein n=1 Tax=Verrucosispora sp. WMMA2121 TaxID=3015164 RepID=UPI0022B5EEF8|nr:right-handed parallel beta-helix repeat-containing protein [Verrucosispora sp. WMMA2121]MCZ7423928.1 right-handed parallel beta-helix repeat-containing protein [Verrucosispora sp. WMMA2121]
MSDDVTTSYGGPPPAPPPAAPPGLRRRKLWLTAGVAGLTGVVGLAALGGVAARDDRSGTSGRSDAQSNARQNVSDAGTADAADSGGEHEATGEHTGRKGAGRKDATGGKDRAHEVPCDTDKLIQAIVHANQNHGGVLTLARHCTYELTRSDDGNGLPVITKPITLTGDDSKIVRAANVERFRILNVGRGGHLTLKGVTVKGGQTAPGITPPAPLAGLEGGTGKPARTGPKAAAKPGADRAKATADGAKAAGAKATGAKAAGAKATGAKAAEVKAAPTVRPAPAARATIGVDVAPPSIAADGVDGGGILVQRGGTADLEHSRIVQNQATRNGGGVANYGTTTIRSSTVEQNSAGSFGGGVFNAGTLRVEESKIVYNTSGAGGGGIANGSTPNGFAGTGGTVWIWKSTISHNRTGVLGGGVFVNGGDTTAVQSQLTDNTSSLDGGGLVALGDSRVSLEHLLVVRNYASDDAGGLGIAEDSTAVVDHSVVKENVAANGAAGGLFNDGASVTLRDSELWGNQASGTAGFAGGIANQDGVTTLIRTRVADNVATNQPGGIYTDNNRVEIDRKSAVTGNRPTNCLGSPVIPERCFG